MNLDLVAEARQDALPLPSTTRKPISLSVPWNSAAFLAIWEVQSHIATIAYVGLVAFTSIWVALVTMLCWSLVATVLFCAARERGYPNVLSCPPCPRTRPGMATAWYAASSVGRALLGGIQAFVFTRFSGALVNDRPAKGLRIVARRAVLALGMTLFGASVTEHLLRSAGYSGRKLVRMGLLGPFLNVPYRILVSAAVVALLNSTLGLFPRV
ncbi:MAG TPA: hypothetical protein VFX19_06865 [Dehalococcoidia bacterium]|nr:hypothetical protein [Dehalococcoidia bacterium]